VQDVIAWLAKRCDKDTVRRLLHVSWAAGPQGRERSMPEWGGTLVSCQNESPSPIGVASNDRRTRCVPSRQTILVLLLIVLVSAK